MIAALAATATLHAAASAQEAVTLVGTWKGKATAVHVGSNPYRVAQGKEPNFPSEEIEFTYVFKRQEGNRFSGESSNGKFNETLIGAFKAGNKDGVILDDDGQYLFTVRDPNTIDLCYSHSFPTSRVVACFTVTRVQ